METIEIHEFSTGIIPEKLAEGQWRSRGYKVGEYMNVTLEQIPNSIERAIANKSFEVSKDRQSKEPTFVGRVILGEDGDWSVVSVVTSGEDEYGRSPSFYRYFLCEGRESLWKILEWIDAQERQGIKTIFNPFDNREKGKPHRHKINKRPPNSLPNDWQNWLQDRPVPVVLPPGFYNLQTINEMAEMKAKNWEISWVYNVETVEEPEQFIILHPANAEAEFRLKQTAVKTTDTSPKINAPNIDLAAMETAVKGLISRSQIKPEWIVNLVGTLKVGQIDSEYLKNLFDRLGASSGMNQENAGEQTIRLLTLRAIVIPETLPEYLDWLQIKSKTKKENNKQTISLQFQSQLKNYVNLLEPLLSQGMNSALEQILLGKMPVPAFNWLLTSQGSLWASYRGKLRQKVRNDLDAIKNSLLTRGINHPSSSFNCGNAIWKKLQTWLQSGKNRCSYYQPLADLFARLPDYELAAYFYQVSQGKVPKEIFIEAFPRSKNALEETVFGLTVLRHVTLIDKTVLMISKYAFALAVAALLIASHTIIFAVGFNVGKLSEEEVADSQITATETPQTTATPTITPTPEEISPEQLQIALNNFPTTRETIEQIVNELQSKYLEQFPPPQPPEQLFLDIVTAMKESLETDLDLQYTGAIIGGFAGEPDKYIQAQRKWIEAIYSYQQKFLGQGLGYIEPQQPTAEKLKCDISDRLGIYLETTPDICLSNNPE
jgi:hypothetical protein